jgi:hypothetical protein
MESFSGSEIFQSIMTVQQLQRSRAAPLSLPHNFGDDCFILKWSNCPKKKSTSMGFKEQVE